MTLSILIVNWNSKDYLRKCLLSIRAHCSDLKPQIIVVDGGSFDGCGEMLAAEFPEVEFVQSPENIGFGRSNNLGFERVTGEAVLLLNPDCEVRSGAVQALLRALVTFPNAGLIGARLLNTDGSLQTSCVQALPTPLNQALDSEFLRKLFPRSRLWGTYEAYRSSSPVPVEAVSGACMLLRSSIFRQVGCFTPDYFMYAEDMDLCLKVHRAGLQIVHLPTAEIVHHGGGSSKTQPSLFSVLKMREALHTYMRLNHGESTASSYKRAMLLSAGLRLVVLAASRGSTSAPKWKCIWRWSLGQDPFPSGHGKRIKTGSTGAQNSCPA